MDGRMLKVFHLHVIACIHLIVSDESFEHLPSIALIQHQVGKTLVLLWRMSPVRSFGYRRRKILRLDRWNGFDEYQVHRQVIQVYRRGREFWNLERRSLTKPFLLWTLMTWKVTKVNRTGYALSLPSLDDRLLDDQGGCIVLDLDVLFTLSSTSNNFPLVFLHSG